MNIVKWMMYSTALLIVVIPTTIALFSATSFSSSFSHTMITLAILLVIAAKLLNVVQKRQQNKTYAGDVGAVVGLLLVVIIRFI
ncbi:histidine kinase [Metabacillus malikii]|uniref:Histidine kinase n=1 Tax=Metabacillus malikii TaxID=1504265 RepID=A0ABT9ZCC3_9BACI|nr:histidine kinase [Metabacillus malikii]MDQ0229892.1 hypothetical protein [Metabacillus malikii]